MFFPPSYVVDLLILKNRVLILRNIQIWVSAVLEGGRSADIHEFHFQAAKRSDMDCVGIQCAPFTDSQEWYLQAAKRSDKSSTIQQEGRFAHAQEKLFHNAKR